MFVIFENPHTQSTEMSLHLGQVIIIRKIMDDRKNSWETRRKGKSQESTALGMEGVDLLRRSLIQHGRYCNPPHGYVYTCAPTD